MLLLDTHVFLWMSARSPELKDRIAETIDAASRTDDVHVCPITFWEIGMLESKGRLKLELPILDWMHEVLSKPGLTLAPYTPEIAIKSTRLPGQLGPDPADHIIVATARALSATLVTRDRDILRYGAAGHVDVMAA